MDNRDDLKQEIEKRLHDFRFFALKGKENETGDRFLLPWIYSHLFGTGKQTKSDIKRAGKEIKEFFNDKELLEIQRDAGDIWLDAIGKHLQDSALVYIKVSKADPSFGRKLLGLVRMSDQEKDNTSFHDIYGGKITLFLKMPDLPYREAMIRSLDESFLTVYPARQGDVDQWLETLPDDSMRAIFRR